MKRRKIFILNLLLILTVATIFMPISQATVENTIFKQESDTSMYNTLNKPIMRIGAYDIDGKEFFIKNAYSGQYLDVSGGIVANGTNIQQYKYNGTDSQRWYIHYNGDGTFSFFTRAGVVDKYQYVLDISNGSSENYANVQLYGYNATDSQKFTIRIMDNYTFAFCTQVSNGSKAIVLNGPSLNQGANVDQYTFQGHINECWILEPVEKTPKLGVEYAYANVGNNRTVYAYPDFRGGDGNCANFVSQCMLASGIHYQNNWYIYRKGTSLSAIPSGDVASINNNWELADPSPWISAKNFSRYWKGKVEYNYYKGSEIISNPSLASNLNMVPGDVIQYAGSGLFGALGDAKHTMYITDVKNSTYYLTYHSGPATDEDLIDVCRRHPDLYFIFYRMI